MIFVTVGTYPIAFDRLIEAVDRAVGDGIIGEDVFAQIGCCNYKPCNFDYVDMMERGEFRSRIRQATRVISHAGIGTIIAALECSRPILVMPRRKRFNEHVNDHQFSTAVKFERLGHVLAAYETADLPGKIEQLRTFVPRRRQPQPEAVVKRIKRFISEMQEQE